MFEDRLSDRLRDLIYPTFQAIVDSHGRVIYYEACVRTFAAPRNNTHVKLLSLAEEIGFIDLVDHVIAGKAIEQALHAGVPVGVNASVFTIERSAESYLRLIGSGRRLPGGLIVEITETIESQNFGLVLEFVRDARRLGARIALDDFGTGSFTDENVDAVRPNLVKIALPRVHEAVSSETGRKWVLDAVATAQRASAMVIAEGIESRAHQVLMENLGIGYFQGFALSMPSHVLPRPSEEVSALSRAFPPNVIPLYRSEAL
ncbi:MAG: EAL domain-containing protein [Betaproteobacteria bacterium]